MLDMNNTTSLEDSPDNYCNHTPYDQFSFFIRVVFMVPVLVFGLGTNTFNIIIFRHPTMRTSMVNWYLIALAASDLSVLVCSFLMLSFPVISEEVQTLQMYSLGAYVQRWAYALGLMAQTCSVGYLLLVSSHRFLGVRYPFVAQRLCTPERVQAVIIGVLVFSVSFNLLRWMELEVAECYSAVYNTTAVRITISHMRSNRHYYLVYMVCTYTLFMFAIPFVLLIIMNSIVIRTVHRSYHLRQRLTQNSGQCSAEQGSGGTANNSGGTGARVVEATAAKENKTTIMLIVVVFVFLICNSLAFINNILEVILVHLAELGIVNLALRLTYETSVEISNFLVVINSSTNMFIYWTFSGKYRSLLKRYMFCTTMTLDRQARNRRSVKFSDTTLLVRNGNCHASQRKTTKDESSRHASVRTKCSNPTTQISSVPPTTQISCIPPVTQNSCVSQTTQNSCIPKITTV